VTEPTQAAGGRKRTQRERILNGMIQAVVREGYAAATIAQTIEHAGVSRPTFYDYFTDKDDCFLAAQRQIAERLLAQTRRAVAHDRPERALQSAIGSLLGFARSQPVDARFLLRDALAGGRRALDERDRAVEQTAQIVERAHAATAPRTPSPDLPTSAAVGAVHWLLASRLSHDESDLEGLADELERWIEAHARPTGEHRRHTLEPGPTPPPSPHVSELPPTAPAPLPPGRSNLSREEVARNQRERILHATAEVSARNGYHAATIADITAAARVDSRVFYTHFHDKLDAALAAQQLGVQHATAVTASAFFSAAAWPERIRQTTLAYMQFQASHPIISRFGLVDVHAIGRPAIEQIHASHNAFTIFLQEGNRHASQPQSHAAMEAIVSASFEIAYRLSRREETEQMARFSKHLAYLCLAPFLGPAAAEETIDAETSASARGDAPAP
jgi:AcrR family transcriptional regulator